MALSDTELILKAQEGNISAFEELVYRYDKHVLSLAMKYSGDNDDAKDIYQEVFLRIYKSIKNFRFRSEFSTWVFRITTNVCLTYKSKQGKRNKISLSYGDDEEQNQLIMNIKAEETDSPDKIVLNSETGRNIDHAVEKLPPKQKICFTLKMLEGYKIKEIAIMLDCKEGTVKKYLFDAIRKVRQNLLEFSYDGA
ncbi:MAG: RNA polymerase sigma factor [Ignavibacteriales bacterium]|nr:MAG: RNA polymerase sigma factor [Ignavibacteriales bacterium]